ncbi:MAG: InlB B-repeat-containing protein [Candidatus Ventricola sp.]
MSLNQEGGVAIWATSEETRNCKSVTAMCIVETESTLPQLDIDTKLDIDHPNQASDLLQQKVETVMADKDALVLYVDAKLLDKRNPNKEIHNVRKSFTVPYEDIPVESEELATNFAAYDFTVLHERIDGKIEEVPFIPRASGLRIGDTTLSPFAIIAFPKENYNLYYDVNGGTGTPLNQSVPMFGESKDVRVSTQRPTRAGFRFLGWSRSRTGEVEYAPGAPLTLDRDTLLYAIWSTADMPQTGDDSRLGLWLTLALASLAALAGMRLRRRKGA